MSAQAAVGVVGRVLWAFPPRTQTANRLTANRQSQALQRALAGGWRGGGRGKVYSRLG